MWSGEKSLQLGTEAPEKVATGGMSIVYRAWQSHLKRPIAIKRIKTELLDRPETKERFRREALSLAKVLHQNVVHVYDYVESPEGDYIVMEFIDGVDLSHVLKEVGTLPPVLAALVAMGITRGLKQLHASSLIHRDIKPSNIRLSTRGDVKLMDFGIVMNLDASGLTSPGLLVGSPGYLSPEQILGDSVTHQTDIFLIGITLYEMLTGTRPFRQDERHSVFQKIREVDYIPLKKMNRSLPRKLIQIVEKCLAQNPADRFNSASELLQALEHFLGSDPCLNSEMILLQFLDQEALLRPSVPMQQTHDTLITRLYSPISLLIPFGTGILVGLLTQLFW